MKQHGLSPEENLSQNMRSFVIEVHCVVVVVSCLPKSNTSPLTVIASLYKDHLTIASQSSSQAQVYCVRHHQGP